MTASTEELSNRQLHTFLQQKQRRVRSPPESILGTFFQILNPSPNILWVIFGENFRWLVLHNSLSSSWQLWFTYMRQCNPQSNPILNDAVEYMNMQSKYHIPRQDLHMHGIVTLQFSSVQFSRSVMSDSLRPCELQHARPPCPSPTPGVHSDSHP